MRRPRQVSILVRVHDENGVDVSYGRSIGLYRQQSSIPAVSEVSSNIVLVQYHRRAAARLMGEFRQRFHTLSFEDAGAFLASSQQYLDDNLAVGVLPTALRTNEEITMARNLLAASIRDYRMQHQHNRDRAGRMSQMTSQAAANAEFLRGAGGSAPHRTPSMRTASIAD